MVRSSGDFLGVCEGGPPPRRADLDGEGPMGRHRAGDGVRAPWQEGTRESLAAVGLDPGAVLEFATRTIAEARGPGGGDATAAVTVPVDDERRAELVAREDGVVAGLLLVPVLLAEAAA